MARRKEIWKIDGRELEVSNLDKVYWPEDGYTKRELLRYYKHVAPTLLPYMQDRPFIMRGWPDGIAGKSFYRWRVPDHAPEWLERFTYQLRTATRTTEMAVVDDLAELLWVVNQGVIEMHPWVATRQNPDRPTWLFFDLDPLDPDGFAQALKVAGWIGEILEELKLRGLAKTSGGKGVHVFVPIADDYTFEQVRDWLGRFIAELERRHHGAVTSDKRLAGRQGKILVDYSQNALGKSIVAPYSVRARPGAPVSTPLSWDEVRHGKVRPTMYTMDSVLDRLVATGDLYRELLDRRQKLPALNSRISS